MARSRGCPDAPEGRNETRADLNAGFGGGGNAVGCIPLHSHKTLSKNPALWRNLDWLGALSLVTLNIY